MAKTSSVQKNLRRKNLIEKFAAKRQELKDIMDNPSASVEERYAARFALSALPRNSRPTRFRNRCYLTGRSRAFYRKFGVSRITLRELVSNGLVPGVIKASW